LGGAKATSSTSTYLDPVQIPTIGYATTRYLDGGSSEARALLEHTGRSSMRMPPL